MKRSEKLYKIADFMVFAGMALSIGSLGTILLTSFIPCIWAHVINVAWMLVLAFIIGGFMLGVSCAISEDARLERIQEKIKESGNEEGA